MRVLVAVVLGTLLVAVIGFTVSVNTIFAEPRGVIMSAEELRLAREVDRIGLEYSEALKAGLPESQTQDIHERYRTAVDNYRALVGRP